MHIPVVYVMKTSLLIAVWIFFCLSPGKEIFFTVLEIERFAPGENFPKGKLKPVFDSLSIDLSVAF